MQYVSIGRRQSREKGCFAVGATFDEIRACGQWELLFVIWRVCRIFIVEYISLYGARYQRRDSTLVPPKKGQTIIFLAPSGRKKGSSASPPGPKGNFLDSVISRSALPYRLSLARSAESNYSA